MNTLRRKQKRRKYKSPFVRIPDSAFNIHRLATFLMRDYCKKRHGDMDKNTMFKMMMAMATRHSTPVMEVPKLASNIIPNTYKVELSNRNDKHVRFVIRKHLENILTE